MGGSEADAKRYGHLDEDVKSGKFGRPKPKMPMGDLFDRLLVSDDDWVMASKHIAVKCWDDPHHFRIVIARIEWTSDEQEVP